jgi:hypothetical protein
VERVKQVSQRAGRIVNDWLSIPRHFVTLAWAFLGLSFAWLLLRLLTHLHER